MTAEPVLVADAYRPELALAADLPELLGVFNRAGVLASADVHAAVRLARLAGDTDGQVLLAAALAVRGPRVGHVSVDLRTVRTSAVVGEDEVDLEALPWPEPGAWVSRVAASPMVGSAGDSAGDSHARVAGDAARGGEGDGERVFPLRLSGSHLYLDRYWRDEVALATDLVERSGAPGTVGLFRPIGESDLHRLFPGSESADQRQAAAAAVTRGLAVLVGGPGTGKTTTIARFLALLCERAVGEGRRPPLIALAAPTGKAAARMEEAVQAEALRMDIPDAVRQVLARLAGTTIHRLLGTRPDRGGQFRHHRSHLLPHEVVVVDEASMVSLSLMARLVEAVRPDARLVLVGDPDQLVSVEAGAVLADIVGPAGDPVRSAADGGPGDGGVARRGPHGAGMAELLDPGRAGAPLPTADGSIAGSISVLRTNHRFSGALARLSAAVRAGDAATTLAILGSGERGVEWEDVDPADLAAASPPPDFGSGTVGRLARPVLAWAEAVRAAAVVGDANAAVAALDSHRLLCAHRRGPAGVAVWNRAVEGWLAASGPAWAAEQIWYPGRPVMVTANDYALRLFNGDTGVAVARPDIAALDGSAGGTGGALRVVFDDGSGRSRVVSPSRLNSIETVFAMTVHKSQGSEFDRVSLLLPSASSRLLTRELLYTALTRARNGILVVGTAQAVTDAVGRPIARASGLATRLWSGASMPRRPLNSRPPEATER